MRSITLTWLDDADMLCETRSMSNDTATATARLISKINNLLAIAERSADNAEEAGTAYAIAQKMIAENALTMEQIRQAQQRDVGGPRTDEPAVQRIVWTHTASSAPSWIGIAAMAICDVNGCSMIWMKGYGPKARELGAPSGVDTVAYISAYGRASDLELVETLIRAITGQIASLAKRSGFEGRTALNNFRLGAVQVVADRLRRGAAEARKALQAAANADTSAPASARECTALALVTLDGREKRAEAARAAAHPNMRTRRVSSRVDHEARAAGQRAGGRVNITPSKALR